MSMSMVSTSDLSDLDLKVGSNDNADLGADNDVDVDANAADDPAASDDGDSGESVVVVDDSADDGNAADDQKDSSDKKETNDDTNDDSDDDAEPFPTCNVSFNKTGDKKVQVGDIVTWKITVKNSENIAWNSYVHEALPKGFEVVSVKASKGEYLKEFNRWEIGNLNESESATLIIKAKAKKAGNFTNKATFTTDSYNIIENGKPQSGAQFAQADVEVTPKDNQKAVVNKNIKKDKKVKDKTKTNNTNETKRKVDLKDAGNPLMVILISIFTVLGLGVLKRQ